MPSQHVDEEMMDFCKQHDLKVVSWFDLSHPKCLPECEDTYKKLLTLGVDVIVTDAPLAVQDFISNFSLS